MSREHTLAERLGISTHISPLRMKLRRLQQQYPAEGAHCLEDWLIDIANARGSRIVTRPDISRNAFLPPPQSILTDEELVVALCQPQCLDRPQMLRLAAQMISRRMVSIRPLRLLAVRERAEPVLIELARQALMVDSAHPVWRAIAETLTSKTKTRDALIHWTRLSEPVPTERGCNARSWRLIA